MTIPADIPSRVIIRRGRPNHPPDLGSVILYADFRPQSVGQVPILHGMYSDDRLGRARASSEWPVGSAVWQIFGGAGGWIANGGPPAWVQYQFAGSVCAGTYSLRPHITNFPGRAPKDWTLQGSNDGVNFKVIDTVSGWTFANSTDVVNFPIYNPGRYSTYRLNMTANNGDGYIALYTFQLYGPKDAVTLYFMGNDGVSHRVW